MHCEHDHCHGDIIGGCVEGSGMKVVNGKDGLSAYELAINLGYVGTEAEWIESLHGAAGDSAYDVAVCEGFTGTKAEWLESIIGPKGDKGDDGRSAYEVAVDNGFPGTEEAWLESLKGPRGLKGDNGEDAYTIAVAHGFSGTEDEWLASLHGADGEDGKSAYQVAVDEGFPGTEAQWLASLKGDEGLSAYEVAVKNGYSGTEVQWLEYIKGAKGDDGDDAYQVAVRNGFAGTEAQWLDSIKGAQGESPYDIAVAHGFTGTEAQWLDSLKGDQGDNGESAYEIAVAQGYVGTEAQWLIDIEGDDGESAYEIAKAYGFIGTEAEWVASLKGETGESAYDIAVANGFSGTESQWLDSLKGQDGQDGESAYDIAVAQGYVGTEAQWVASLKGDQGDDGIQGPRGESAYEVALSNGFIGTEAEWLASLKGDDADVDLTDYAKISDIPVVPTNVSAFTNDVGYIYSANSYVDPTDNTVMINGVSLTALTPSSDLDATKVVGILPVESIPKTALDNLVTVKSQGDMLNLTADDVKKGDTVRVTDDNKLYMVADVSKLGSMDAFVEYSTAVRWDDITGDPGYWGVYTNEAQYMRIAGIEPKTELPSLRIYAPDYKVDSNIYVNLYGSYITQDSIYESDAISGICVPSRLGASGAGPYIIGGKMGHDDYSITTKKYVDDLMTDHTHSKITNDDASHPTTIETNTGMIDGWVRNTATNKQAQLHMDEESISFTVANGNEKTANYLAVYPEDVRIKQMGTHALSVTTKEYVDQAIEDAAGGAVKNLKFINGTNTTVTVTDPMTIAYHVKPNLTGIESITFTHADDAEDAEIISIDSTNGISAGSKTIKNVAAAEAQTDAVNFKQMKDAIAAIDPGGVAPDTVYLKDQIDGFLELKQDKLTAGTNITIDSDNVISCDIDTSLYLVVSALPVTGDPTKIYLLKETTAGGKVSFAQYAYLDDNWERIGEVDSADVKMDDYYTKEESDDRYLTKESQVSGILEKVYPIGAIYISAIDIEDPALLFGFGSWRRIGDGRVFMGAGTGTDANNNTYTVTAGASNDGEYKHQLTIDEMPSHTHVATVPNAGTHTHTMTCAQDGAHEHNMYFRRTKKSGTDSFTCMSFDENRDSSNKNKDFDYKNRFEDKTQTGGKHNHTVTAADNGSHSHSVTNAKTGQDVAHSNILPSFGIYAYQRYL